jgi:predicted lipoprotein with Yx(FWY)xxD motif
MRISHMVAATALGAIALTACGGGGYGGSSKSSNTTTPPAAAAATGNTAANAAAGNVHTANTKLGTILVDGNGMTVYGFANDSMGTSTCDGGCASVWPPVTVNGSALPAGLDANLFSVITRSDGSHQLRAGKWPLYLFDGDTARGDVNGQGSENFFVVNPDGSLHK